MTMVRGRVGETQLTVESAHQWLSFLVIHQNNCGVLNTFPLDYPQGQLRQNLDIIRVHQQRMAKGSKAESLGRHGLYSGGWGDGSSGKSTIHASMLTQVQSLTSHIKLDKLPCVCNLRIPAGRWQQSPEAGGICSRTADTEGSCLSKWRLRPAPESCPLTTTQTPRQNHIYSHTHTQQKNQTSSKRGFSDQDSNFNTLPLPNTSLRICLQVARCSSGAARPFSGPCIKSFFVFVLF